MRRLLMKPKDKERLMGIVVLVKRTFELVIDAQGYRRWVDRPTTPRSGWVVGFRTFYEGVVHRGDPAASDSPGWFEPKGAIQVMMVSFWYNRAPVPVPLNGWDYSMFGPESPHKWPLTQVSDRDREVLRQEANNLPRGAGGRWMKKS